MHRLLPWFTFVVVNATGWAAAGLALVRTGKRAAAKTTAAATLRPRDRGPERRPSPTAGRANGLRARDVCR
ncbi:MAG: hypothetical protein ACRDPO_35370 [Streptosporangiaceae bacterium]